MLGILSRMDKILPNPTIAPASNGARAPMSRDFKTFLGMLALWAIINFVFIRLNNFSLAEDEAQYWDWSRHCALGFYSKPPLIAYYIHLLTSLMGHSEWAIRSGAALCSLGTLVLVRAITLRIAKRERVALIAVCLTLAMPFTWAGSVIMTVDPLLVFFWALSMYAFHRAANGEPKMWWLTGFALGMGMLGKYTIMLLVLSFALYLIFVDRAPLKTFGPYAALIIMFLCLSGVIYWNATNDWVSFRHTASIGADASKSFSKIFKRMYEYFGGQAGIVSPLLFGFLVWGMISMAKRFRKSRDAAFLLLCGTTLFVFYTCVAITHRTEPNWPVCSYIAAVPALAWAWERKDRSRRMRFLLYAAVVLGCLIGVSARSTNVLYLWTDVIGGRDARTDKIHIGRFSIDPSRDPTNRLIGGRELGQALAKYVKGGPDDPFIFTPRYQITAWAAFYTPGQPRVYFANPEERYNQYDLWGGWDQLKGKDALFVYGGDDITPEDLIGKFVQLGAFESGEPLETVRIFRGKTQVKNYNIIKLHKYTGREWGKETVKF
jgi:hypothetical protein